MFTILFALFWTHSNILTCFLWWSRATPVHCRMGTPLAHVQFHVHQDPWVLFCRAAFQLVTPSLHCCTGLFLFRCKTSRLSLFFISWGSCQSISPAYSGRLVSRPAFQTINHCSQPLHPLLPLSSFVSATDVLNALYSTRLVIILFPVLVPISIPEGHHQ